MTAARGSLSGDDWLASVDRGLVLVTVSPDGVLGERWRLSDREPLEVPTVPAVFVYAREIPCVTLPAGEDVDLSGILRDGALLGTLEHDGEAMIDVRVEGGGAARLWPRAIQGRGRATMEALDANTHRLLVQRRRRDREVFSLTIDSPATGITARLKPSGEFSAIRVCQALPPWLPETGSLGVGPSENRRFAAGWHDAERPDLLWFRWSEKTSTLVLPLQTRTAARLLLRLRAAHAGGANIQGVAANGQRVRHVRAAGRPMDRLPDRYSGEPPPCRRESRDARVRHGGNARTRRPAGTGLRDAGVEHPARKFFPLGIAGWPRPIRRNPLHLQALVAVHQSRPSDS